MELLNFIFRLGVVFAIFGFIWGLIDFGFMILSSGRERQLPEIYILKAVKYFFLVNITFLICSNGKIDNLNQQSQMVFGSIVLLMYFLGRFQNAQNKQVMFQMVANGIMRNKPKFNARAETGVIVFALAMFILFWFTPQIANNPVATWFQDAILNIEDTPIFGFIFKIIGFFFLISILFKMVNSVLYLLSGNAFKPTNNNNNDNQNNRNDFDSYEEVE